MSPRTGRPPIENPRNQDINIRLTAREKEELQYVADELGISRTDAIMQGIVLLKKQIEKNKKKARKSMNESQIEKEIERYKVRLEEQGNEWIEKMVEKNLDGNKTEEELRAYFKEQSALQMADMIEKYKKEIESK